MKFGKYWWLGFLGLIGVYQTPMMIDVISNGGSYLKLINVLWYFWFLEFIPKGDKGRAKI